MIAEDIRFLDIDAYHWAKLIGLVARLASGGTGTDGTAGRRRMLILFKGRRVLKAIHSELGIIRDLAFNGPDRLRTVAEEYETDAVWAIEEGAVVRMLSTAESKVRHDDDLVEQALCYYSAFREEAGRGILRFPDSITGLPEMRYRWFARMMRVVLPRRRAVVFYIFEGDDIYTSLILGTNDRDLDIITTNDHFASADLRMDDWRLGYRSVLKAVEGRIAPVYLGVFAERRGIEMLFSGKGSLRDRVEEGIRAGDLVLDPVPVRLKAALFMEDLYKRIKRAVKAKEDFPL